MQTDLLSRYPQLAPCADAIDAVLQHLVHCYSHGGKLLVCGNGGSCADADHIVGELMKGFMRKRPLDAEIARALQGVDAQAGGELARSLQRALPAINLCAQAAVLTAFGNDVGFELAYAQLTLGYAAEGDVLLCISTSGNSVSVVNAAIAGKARGAVVLGLTGRDECALDRYCDAVIHAPETETYKIQELHLPVYHYLCAETERHFFDE